MKTIFSILSLTIFISCNSDSERDNKERNQNIIKTIQITDNIEILGNWTMCASFGNGIIIQMNDCLKISFNYNGTGTIQNKQSVEENFHWTFKDNVLTIINKLPQFEHIFSDTTYEVLIAKKENLFNLTMTEPKFGSQYYLTR